MSDNLSSNHDPLEEAIRAFHRMTVGERPSDAEVLVRMGASQAGVLSRSRVSVPWRMRFFMVASTAAAVAMLGGLALLLRNGPAPESVQVSAAFSPDQAEAAAVRPPSTGDEPERTHVPPLRESVAESQVIVVATGLDAAPAPPEVPGDSPEFYIRWQVRRVLKGELNKKEFTTRTSTAAAEFIGKEWIVFLTPDYVAGKHKLASYLHIQFEPTVKSYLPQEK